MKYIFSIIIPHYNIPELLVRCLKSIPVREDIQVIVVDDCSPDADTYKERFPEFSRPYLEWYSTPQGGSAGRARNIGLEHAKGKWILFADADDVFEKDLDKILEILKDDMQSDLINFDVTSRNLEDDMPNDEIDRIGYHCNQPKYLQNPASFKYIVLTPWGKAIQRELIEEHNIQFEEVKHGNDILFSTLCDFYCKHRRLIPLVGYCYMHRENSLWRQESLEWAIIRYKVMLNCGLTMKKLGDKDVADRYLNIAYSFIQIMQKYSKFQYIRYMFEYGIKRPDLKVLFKKVPKAIILYLINTIKIK